MNRILISFCPLGESTTPEAHREGDNDRGDRFQGRRQRPTQKSQDVIGVLTPHAPRLLPL